MLMVAAFTTITVALATFLLNPFYATSFFQCSPKALENQSFMFSGDIERDQWHELG